MTIAEIHGKLPDYGNMEDLLTSDVFSTFKYLPPQDGLIPFLKQAISFQTGRRIDVSFKNVNKADYIFWPKTSFFKREPDLLILLTCRDHSPITVVIEAKYKSGKSNMERELNDDEVNQLEGDQLAEQYVDLMEGRMELPRQYKEKLLQSSTRLLIYVTANDILPVEALKETEQVLLKKKLAGDGLSNLYWVNWQAAYSITQNKDTDNLQEGQQLMLEDLNRLLERKGLVTFKGFSKPLYVQQKNKYFWSE